MDSKAADRLEIAALYGCVALLHVVGCALYCHYIRTFPSLIGFGLLAYMFGLRHAFDADHIAAVDDTVRIMIQRQRRPLSAGFFFSLGHSTIVFALAIGVATSADAVKRHLPLLQDVGGMIAGGVSGIFLWIVGIVNLVFLLDMLRNWRKAKTAHADHRRLETPSMQRSFFYGLFGKRLGKFMQHAWHMYPLGLVFGLGFDTASEVGLLAMTAGASTGNLPAPAILSLPILFAAGMTLMDTTDGVLMVKAYRWAMLNPLRKIVCSAAIMGLSVAIALFVGTIEIIQLLGAQFRLQGGVYRLLARIDFAPLGYLVVGLLLLTWGGSLFWWKVIRGEKRPASALQSCGR